ncbi:metal-sensitive transcriptional regulator [Brevibacillus humidisoli]|uniref:metal-sensitive transcriptional regulator n=1 Tax=Brevibacillus humidisoli TaxID=2895522 RepID=UPI001E5D76F0|nr:metal-sensitive transcriptional regulator [Brevibacillus humidisoli]UFJ41750.1 metal-sensitive transcriptional regulator [Brevibacillus humidisoli]
MNYGDHIKNRLKRVEGQVRGVLGMIEADKDCKDVVGQLAAIRSAIDKTIAVIVAENLATCIRDEIEQGGNADQIVQEAIYLLVKSR